MYKYVDKYFDFHERSRIWSKINTNEDVEGIFNACKSQVEMTKQIHIKDRVRQDNEDGKRALANIEIALRRINEFPDKFSFTEEEINNFKEKFLEYEKEIHNLDLQRISWD